MIFTMNIPPLRDQRPLGK